MFSTKIIPQPQECFKYRNISIQPLSYVGCSLRASILPRDEFDEITQYITLFGNTLPISSTEYIQLTLPSQKIYIVTQHNAVHYILMQEYSDTNKHGTIFHVDTLGHPDNLQNNVEFSSNHQSHLQNFMNNRVTAANFMSAVANLFPNLQRHYLYGLKYASHYCYDWGGAPFHKIETLSLGSISSAKHTSIASIDLDIFGRLAKDLHADSVVEHYLETLT